MRQFAVFSGCYLMCAVIPVALLHPDGAAILSVRVEEIARKAVEVWPLALPAALAVLVVLWRSGVTATGALLKRAAFAFAGCAMFLPAFSTFKTMMPMVSDFRFDPLMAEIDRVLHGGRDPWRILHDLPWRIDPSLVDTIYIYGWFAPAVFFPVLLALFDADGARRDRFVLLWLFVWIGLGNILAFVFLSAGPVFYDGLLGTERFAGLDAALAEGLGTGFVRQVQGLLWEGYVDGTLGLGSGISAFPSVHVATVTLGALYLWERSALLAPVSVALVVVFQGLSVYTGFHYAIDGYASILLVCGAWAWLGARRPARSLA